MDITLSQHFTPWASLGGGTVIGAAASALLATHGKILGISGILFSATGPREAKGGGPDAGAHDRKWRLAFVSGLLSAGSVLAAVVPGVFGGVATTYGSAGFVSLPVAAVAGLAVGWGTKVGSGCTSGHGVCGLPRLSVRSLVAVGVFMGAAAATVAATSTGVLAERLVVPVAQRAAVGIVGNVATWAAGAALAAAVLFPAPTAAAEVKKLPASAFVPSSSAASIGLAYGIGALFGVGLGLSGMLVPAKVLGFLHPTAFAEGWDPSLALVMGGAVVLNLVTFPLLAARPNTVLTPYPADLPCSTAITPALIAGSAVFGIGWGLAGVCPGPAVVSIATGEPAFLAWIAAFFAGQALYRTGIHKPLLG